MVFGTHCCHKRNHWLHVSFEHNNRANRIHFELISEPNANKNRIIFSIRMSWTRSIEFDLCATASAVDFGWQKRWRLHIRCTATIATPSIPSAWKCNQMLSHRSAWRALRYWFSRRWYSSKLPFHPLLSERFHFQAFNFIDSKWKQNLFFVTGMGSIGAYVIVYVPRRACKEQLLQAHWPGCDPNPSRCTRTPVFVRCWWLNESASTTRPRVNRPNFILNKHKRILIVNTYQKKAKTTRRRMRIDPHKTH